MQNEYVDNGWLDHLCDVPACIAVRSNHECVNNACIFGHDGYEERFEQAKLHQYHHDYCY